MAGNVPYQTTGGYVGPPSINTAPSGQTALVNDSVDGFAVLAPALAPNGTGALIPAVVDATTVAIGAGMPEINAILIELRVLVQLLHLQLGNPQLDLEQMRADEAWNTNVLTGTL